MLDGLVRAGELGKVVAHHLGLDFDGVEDLSAVDCNDRANHFGNNDHVTKMGLDNSGLLVRQSLLLGFAQFLDEAQGTALETTLEAAAGTGMDELRIRWFTAEMRKSNKTYFDKLVKMSKFA